MADHPVPSAGPQVQISASDEVARGRYSNNMLVTHTREEFILDFMMIAPPSGAVTARIVCSPGHLKRIIAALQDNLGKYEARFGAVHQAEGPQGNIGFTRQ